MAEGPLTRSGSRRYPPPPKECLICQGDMSGRDPHDTCIDCLGRKHEVKGRGLDTSYCAVCGAMPPRALNKRVSYFERAAPPEEETPSSTPLPAAQERTPPSLTRELAAPQPVDQLAPRREAPDAFPGGAEETRRSKGSLPFFDEGNGEEDDAEALRPSSSCTPTRRPVEPLSAERLRVHNSSSRPCVKSRPPGLACRGHKQTQKASAWSASSTACGPLSERSPSG